MRLDHLLSKEHWHLGFLVLCGWEPVRGVQVALSQPFVLWGLLKGGTSIIWCWSCGGCCEYWFFSSGLGQGKWRIGWVVLGTLLGPEGSGVVLLSSSVRALLAGRTAASFGGGWRRRVVGFRPYFENYTVDASIFVAKFLRAHGGCLGTRNRRRT